MFNGYTPEGKDSTRDSQVVRETVIVMYRQA
jgi:hypothetical protein